jgi:hypothetical protein
MPESGEVKNMKEITRKEGVDDSYVSRIVNPTTLAPDIDAAILDERRAPCRTPPRQGGSTEPDHATFMLPIPNSTSLGIRCRLHLGFWMDPFENRSS